MKLINIFLIILFISVNNIYSQTTFEKTIGGSQVDAAYGIIVTKDSNLLISAGTEDFNGHFDGVFLIKTDLNGDTIWTNFSNDNHTGAMVKFQSYFDLGYVSVGGYWNYNTSKHNVLIIRVDNNGDTLWLKKYGGSDMDYGTGYVILPDSGLMVCGVTESFSNGKEDIYILRTDKNGDTLWSTTYGGGGMDISRAIIKDTDSTFLISGYTYSYGAGNSDMFIFKINDYGDSIWFKTYGNSSVDFYGTVKQTTDGGFVITGSKTAGGNNTDFVLIKTDSAGNQLWEKTYGYYSFDEALDIQLTSDGGYIIVGYGVPNGYTRKDVYIVKTDSNGDTIWTRTYGGSGDEEGWSIAETPDSGYAIVGRTTPYGSGDMDIYFLKINQQGNITAGTGFIPERSIALSVFPNPATTQINIDFFTKNHLQKLHFQLYDSSGKLVQENILNDFQRIYSIYLKDLKTGLYIYRLLDKDGLVKSGKIVVQ